MRRRDDRPLPDDLLARPAAAVARDLVGCLLVRTLPGGEEIRVRLVETEAYLGAADRASHAWRGRRSARNASLFLGPGHAYVYFVYGLHHCLNVVAGDPGLGGAVLLRAAEVLAGEPTVRRLRRLDRTPRPGELLGGPGRLCQGLAVDRGLDGIRFAATAPLALFAGEPAAGAEVVATPRIGVEYAGEAATWPLRFALAGHPEVSRPRPPAGGPPVSRRGPAA